MLPPTTTRNFLIFWLGGWVLFLLVGVLQPGTGMGIAEFDMEQHRRAGSADMVNIIHASWQATKVYQNALWSLVVDLGFITMISIGGILGGQLLRRSSAKNVPRVGVLAIVAHIVFAVTDYSETISQLIQMVQGEGSDTLAGFAALMRPIKMQSFLIGFAALAIGYVASLLHKRKNDRQS